LSAQAEHFNVRLGELVVVIPQATRLGTAAARAWDHVPSLSSGFPGTPVIG